MSTASLSPLFSMFALVMFVFGGYLFAGGDLKIFLHALPHTFMAVVLGALATTWVLTTVGGRGVFRAIKQALRGRRFQRVDYRELAEVLMVELKTPNAPSILRGNEPFLRHDSAVHMIRDAKALMDLDHFGVDQLGSFFRTRIDAILAGETRTTVVLRAMSSNLVRHGRLPPWSDKNLRITQ